MSSEWYYDSPSTVAGALQRGLGGDRVAIDGLREYVRHGADRVDALEEMATAWPAELWDDLLPVAADRLRPAATTRLAA
ncbi:hypothetical protein GCM10009827_005060 [Dactylosporangium maewongense]|uniref:Uncharacterized protein n=1 Tax=Dactylosporangium maewongense TaxID=634393 RepID=A0ABP4KA19_9ACTN